MVREKKPRTSFPWNDMFGFNPSKSTSIFILTLMQVISKWSFDCVKLIIFCCLCAKRTKRKENISV